MLWSRQRAADASRARRIARARFAIVTGVALVALTGARPAPWPPAARPGPLAAHHSPDAAAPDRAVATYPAQAPPPGPPSRATAPGPATASRAAPVRAAFDALPAGAPPTTVPYAIGARVFAAGTVTDLAARFDPALAAGRRGRQFVTVTGDGDTVWTQAGAARPDGSVLHAVGRLARDGGFTQLPRSTGRPSGLAVTSTGLVAVPESGEVYAPGGAPAAAFTGSAGIDCGFCGATAAGPRLVLDQWTGPVERPTHQATWLWLPPAAVQRIDDRFVAVGRQGPGWLGLRLDGGCWRIAPATAPDRLGATVCSQTRPLVGADGRSAVVVQGGRARVVDPLTGATRSVAALDALGPWTPADADPRRVAYAVPAVWETGDAYLVTARAGTALALVRCSARTGACERTVRAAVRPGVEAVVTERGPQDAVPAG